VRPAPAARRSAPPGTKFCEECGESLRGKQRHASAHSDHAQATRDLKRAEKAIAFSRFWLILYAVLSGLLFLGVLGEENSEPGDGTAAAALVLGVMTTVLITAAVRIKREPFLWTTLAASVWTLVLVFLWLSGGVPGIVGMAILGVMLVGMWSAVLFLGKGAWRESLAEQPNELGVLLGLVAIPVCLVMNVAYVYIMQALVESPEVMLELEQPNPLFLIVAGAVLPALLEEWVDRGVIWTACMRATTEGRTIFLTAGLFALSHGLNGGFLLELPHRFAMGLVLGWLRARTGSLLPCVLAHFGNNLVAIALF
jgi:membrane protease YdiL (CAAX protease family)